MSLNPSFRISKEFRFEAAHYLPHHDGKCARMHGHSWVGHVVLESEVIENTGPKQNMVMDFADIKAIIEKDVENLLDHHCLNVTLPIESPTAEAVAMFLYNAWKYALPTLVYVRIEETCTSAVEYGIGGSI